MANVKVVLKREGVRELLKSQEMMNACTSLAYRVQAKLGNGYGVTYMTGKNRVNASIGTVNDEAKKENYESNTILKALGELK